MEPTLLDELMMYYRYTRRAGHTTFMIDGIRFERPAVILFGSTSHAQQAFNETVLRYGIVRPNFNRRQIGQVRFTTIAWLSNLHENIRGRGFEDLPVVIVDHYALEALILDDRERREQKR